MTFWTFEEAEKWFKNNPTKAAICRNGDSWDEIPNIEEAEKFFSRKAENPFDVKSTVCWLCGDTKIEYVFIDDKRTAVNCSECVKPQALPTGNKIVGVTNLRS